MTRLKDVLLGTLIGIIAMGAIVAFAASTTMDPVQLSPQYYTVRIDNARVRVLEYRLKPGEKEIMHSHPAGVVFTLADATVRNSFPDGSVVTHPSVAGDVKWRDALTHDAENVGTTDVHAFAVELKECSKK